MLVVAQRLSKYFERDQGNLVENIFIAHVIFQE